MNRWGRGILALLMPALFGCQTGEQRVEAEKLLIARGEALYKEAGCWSCHGDPGEGGQLAPDLSAFRPVADPLILAAAMWNHLPTMVAWMEERGNSWPRIRPGDLESLLAYLRSAGQPSATETRLWPPDSRSGGKIFLAKGCLACHTMDPVGMGEATLSSLAGFRRAHLQPVDVAMAMWNAGPIMVREAHEAGQDLPRLQWQELADLAAFLLDLPPEANPSPPPP